MSFRWYFDIEIDLDVVAEVQASMTHLDVLDLSDFDTMRDRREVECVWEWEEALGSGDFNFFGMLLCGTMWYYVLIAY